MTFQDSSIPLTRSIDPGKPFLTFSEGTRSIADISFSDGERTANWSDVSGDGLNEPSEPLDCAPLLSKKSSCTTSLPSPASSMFGLTGREAVLFDAAAAQRYPREDNDIVLPSLREYGSFEENGKTVVICDLHYDFYYDYTGPDWEWNGGGATTVARFELDAPGDVCTGFAAYPSGNLSDWIRDFCGPLAVQNADGAWVLPEASGDWFPAVENLFQQYLEVIASTAPSSDAPAEAALSEDMIWESVHEKLDYAHWIQAMTEEYENSVRKFELEDSRLSDKPGDVSQWPRYYSVLVDYFTGMNADLHYLDADAVWTKDLSEDGQTMIVTMTRGDEALTLSYSLQTQEISSGDSLPAIMTLTIFDLNTSPSGEKTCTLSAEDAAILDELFSIDSMTPTASDSESVCAYQFDIENRSYLLDDSLNYVDAIMRESEDNYTYYGKHLSDSEIESLKAVIEVYTK